MVTGDGVPDDPVLTDRVVVLRRPTRADVPVLVDAIRSSLHVLQPWMAWAVPDYGADNVHGFLDDVEAGRERAFAVLDTHARLRGMCSLTRVDETNRTGNLGYWLRADATGAGWATHAARLVTVHGLDALALERVEVVMSVANDPSRRVAERLGLAHEGIRRRALRIGGEQHDAHVFVAVREDLPRLLDER